MGCFSRSKVAGLCGAAIGLGVTAFAIGGASAPAPASQAQHASGFFGAVMKYLEGQPFVVLFTMLALGYLLARIEIKGVSMGATGSTLVVSLFVSVIASKLFGIQFRLPEFASAIFFNLFMFAVGMKVGPQFLSGLRRDAKSFFVLAFLVPFLSLGLMIALRQMFQLEPGLAPGIFAGSNTATPGLGAAQAAYAASPNKDLALGNLSTAFAFAYCISTALFIVMLKVMPGLFGRDVVKDAKDFEAAISTGGAALPGTSQSLVTDSGPARVRTYKVERERLIGQNLAKLRHAHPRVSVENVMRDGRVLALQDDLVLKRDDIVALHSRVDLLMMAANEVGPEVDAPGIRDMPSETAEIVIQKRGAGMSLLEVVRGVGYGLYLNAMFRGGVQIPFGAETTLAKGDVFRVTGTKHRLSQLEKATGHLVQPSMATDIVTLAVGLMLGALIGSIPIPVGEVKIAVGSAVGLLLVGIALSTLRTRNPELGGPFPEPARLLLQEIGLNVFVAVLGLNSGAGVVVALASGALTPIVVGCVIVGLTPPFIAWLVGHYWLKMNSALLLGGVAGARCSSPGLKAGQEATKSNVPAISYPVTFAISNLLFTLMAYGLALWD